VAELTNLEEKLAEVLGLAMAAQGATEKVKKLVDEEEGQEELAQALERMHAEARETEERCTELAASLDGKKTAILEKARETKQEATEMMRTYLGEAPDALDGFEFLTMAEAGEVGHWEVVRVLADRSGKHSVRHLAQWAEPIQQRHLETAFEGSRKLAASEDPNATA
jgi:dsDNA-specific endonuclease/ATPase MutS2